ncbi:putative inactive receptor kinase [Camellia lanceoleosa]|uniref:Inactive receptor kinase n=1 Tax=Camellia lanceoleosa TaxID=1840588 RepID=A0ACC0GN28_9ERIC|nr:putative inactive receptor kinase [Camellia lanceoleosa]
MMMANGKREMSNDGANVLVFFNNEVTTIRVFNLEDLLRASLEVLGKWTFEMAYMAVLEVGMVVEVKRLNDVIISKRDFREKIENAEAMDRGNLVPLRAYYFNREEKLVVYDYMSMRSLLVGSLLFDCYRFVIVVVVVDDNEDDDECC